MSPEQVRKVADQLTKDLAEQGRIVQGGWLAYVLLTGLDNAPEIQWREMRKAYFAGAQHLFASILTVLDEGTEATGKDLTTFEKIHAELEGWVNEMKGKLR